MKTCKMVEVAKLDQFSFSEVVNLLILFFKKSLQNLVYE